jgi:integrase
VRSISNADSHLSAIPLRFNVTRSCYRGWLRMRTRHQEGRVEERGGTRKRWYGHYYVYVRDAAGKEVRRHVGVALGNKAELLKWEAKEKLKKFIAAAGAIEQQLRRLIDERGLDPVQQAELQAKVQTLISSESDPELGAARAIAFLNTRVQPTADHLTLQWYTEERFLPMRKAGWAPSTRETNLYHINQHILPCLGAVPLARLDKFRCQTFLNDLAMPRERAPHGFSFTVIDHCRTMLKAILEEAVDAELIGKNPARKLANPETQESEKFVLPKDQARALLEALPFRDRLMAMIAAFCAMRPGEIFGLRWSSWRGDHLQIEGTAWRGVLRPGKAKTKGSKAAIVLPDILIPALKMWREHCKNPSPEALIFPSGQETPMRPENWLRRRVKPIAAKLKISVPVNFQVLRRTFATNAQGFGGMKDVQTHLRHTDITTTANVYTQPIAESVRKLVNAVTHDVMTAEQQPAAIQQPAPLTQRVQ